MSKLNTSAVTESKVKNIMQSGVLDNAPSGSTHYDMFWCQFLKKSAEFLMFYEDNRWKVSNHRDGVAMLNNGECFNLSTKQLENKA